MRETRLRPSLDGDPSDETKAPGLPRAEILELSRSGQNVLHWRSF
jgi:hypothetical protein